MASPTSLLRSTRHATLAGLLCAGLCVFDEVFCLRVLGYEPRRILTMFVCARKMPSKCICKQCGKTVAEAGMYALHCTRKPSNWICPRIAKRQTPNAKRVAQVSPRCL